MNTDRLSLVFWKWLNGRFCLFWGVVLVLTLLAAGNCHAGELELSPAEQAWLADHPVIRLAPDPDFPPIESIEANGTYQGISADYMEMVEKMLGIEFQVIRCNNWDDVLRRTKNHEVDLLPAAANTPDRREYLRFTDPHLILPGVIISQKDYRTISNLNEVQAGEEIAVVSGYVWQEMIERNYPDLKLVLVKDLVSGLRGVSFGEADYLIATLPVAIHYIEEEGIANLRVTGNTGFYTRLSAAVRSDWPIFHGILQKALSQISPTENTAIMSRWIHLKKEPIWKRRAFWAPLLSVVGALVLVIAVIYVWNRSLRRAIRNNTRELKITEEKFRNMADLLPEVIFECDLAGNLTYVNNIAFEKYGYSEEDYNRGLTALQIIAPDDRERAGENIKKVLRGEKSRGHEYKALRKNGSEFSVVAYSSPIMSNNITVGMRGIIVDLTKIKQAEAQVRESQELFAAFMDNFPGPAFISEPGKAMIYANKPLHEIFGLESGEEVNYDLLSSPDRLDQIEEQDRLVLAKGEPVKFQETIPKLTGEIQWITHKFPIPRAGKSTLIGGLSLDITVSKKAEESLQNLKNSLEEEVSKKTEELQGRIENSERSRKAMLYMVEDLNRTSRELKSAQEHLVRSERLAAIGELAGGVAHELRNSLGVLTNAVAYLELVIPMADPTIKKNFNHMKENVARANKVISDLLDYARDIKAAQSAFPISPVIDGILKDINIPGGIKVEKHWPEEEACLVFADQDQVYHIIFNLLKNAVESMTTPGSNPDVGKLTLSCRREDNGKIIFSISDTGSGILPEDEEKIFNPLFTRKSSGIGLGLSISRRYAELNGGTLDVESELGVGSTFILTLPIGKNTQIHTDANTN
jgi:PAS domain S-box-containing protein